MRLTDQQIKNLHRNNKVKFKALSVPCEDCNILWHPFVMSFDHRNRDTKKGWVSNLASEDPEIFDAEIAKCDVVCLNCHKIREYIRDLGVLNFNKYKQPTHRYYERLLPYLCGGAILRKDAYTWVKVGIR